MKAVIASIFALGLLGASAVPASAITIHFGGGGRHWHGYHHYHYWHRGWGYRHHYWGHRWGHHWRHHW